MKSVSVSPLGSWSIRTRDSGRASTQICWRISGGSRPNLGKEVRGEAVDLDLHRRCSVDVDVPTSSCERILRSSAASDQASWTTRAYRLKRSLNQPPSMLMRMSNWNQNGWQGCKSSVDVVLLGLAAAEGKPKMWGIAKACNMFRMCVVKEPID